jgi:hypothetical protein
VGGEIKGAFLKNEGGGEMLKKVLQVFWGKIHTGLNKRKKKTEGFGNKMAPQHDLHRSCNFVFWGLNFLDK